MINYTPFGHSDWQTIVADIKKFGSAGKKTAVVSTINGDANVPFYKELGNQGIKADDIPVVAFSVGEEELAGLDTTPLVGHLAAWNYFMSVDTPENADFIEKWHAFIKNDKRVTNDPMEAHVIGFNMWVKAVEKAGTTDPDAVIDAIVGVSVPNLTGGYLDDDAQPPHHQAGADRRDPGRRPVRDRLGDLGPRRRRRVVGLPAGLQGPDLRLARAAVVRQLQRRTGKCGGKGGRTEPRATCERRPAASSAASGHPRCQTSDRIAVHALGFDRLLAHVAVLALRIAAGCMRADAGPGRRSAIGFAVGQVRRHRGRRSRGARRHRRSAAIADPRRAGATAICCRKADAQAARVCHRAAADGSLLDALTGEAAGDMPPATQARQASTTACAAPSTPRWAA